MLNRHQQIQKNQPQRVQSRFSVRAATKLCPRGDLAIYDTGRDLANRYLTVVHAGVTHSDVERSD